MIACEDDDDDDNYAQEVKRARKCDQEIENEIKDFLADTEEERRHPEEDEELNKIDFQESVFKYLLMVEPDAKWPQEASDAAKRGDKTEVLRIVTDAFVVSQKLNHTRESRQDSRLVHFAQLIRKDLSEMREKRMNHLASVYAHPKSAKVTFRYIPDTQYRTDDPIKVKTSAGWTLWDLDQVHYDKVDHILITTQQDNLSVEQSNLGGYIDFTTTLPVSFVPVNGRRAVCVEYTSRRVYEFVDNFSIANWRARDTKAIASTKIGLPN